jgi:epsin
LMRRAKTKASTVSILHSGSLPARRTIGLRCIVRNRSSEIALLLGDVDKIRQERRKAKANKNKYGGTGSDGGSLSFGGGGSGRYGGFGSEDIGGARSSSSGFAEQDGKLAIRP